MPLVPGCLITVKIPEDFQKDLETQVRYIYTYGMFGSMKSVPFTISGDEITIEEACSVLLFNT